MQKSPLFALIREEFIRAFVFGCIFVVTVSVGFTGIAYAANGGVFGNLLNQILASGNWESPGDGTVKNTTKLGGKLPAEFVPLATSTADRSCTLANQCIYGFDTSGKGLCR